MHKYFLIACIIIIFIAPQILSETPITFSVTVNSSNNQVQSAHVVPFENSMRFLKQHQETVGEHLRAIANIIKANKGRSTCIVAAVVWLKINYKLWRLASVLRAKDHWSLWRSGPLLDPLLTYPQRELTQQLLLDIQKKYTTSARPTEFIQPLIIFLTTLEEEQKNLKQYKTLCNILKRINIGGLFMLDKELMQEVDQRLQKLLYIKNLFLSWAAEYKVAHYENPLLNLSKTS